MMNLQYEINSVLTRTGYKMTNKRKLLIKLISNRNSEFISARIIHKEANPRYQFRYGLQNIVFVGEKRIYREERYVGKRM